MKTIIFTEKAPKPLGAYSQGVKIENTLYISGQIAIDINTGNIESSDIADETKIVMSHIGAILNKANMDYSHIIKCSIFVKDISEFNIVNSIYEKYFDSDAPARETVEVSNLPKNARIEISAIAIK